MSYDQAALGSLALVTIGDNATARLCGAGVVSSAAWTRWLATVQELAAGAAGITLGAIIERAAAALPRASQSFAQ